MSDHTNGAEPHVVCPRPVPNSAWLQDWTIDAETRECIDGYSYITIPTGQLLYKGVDVELPDDAQAPDAYSTASSTFVSSVATACKYAFEGSTTLSRNGTYGKVICLEATRPLRLINMWSHHNHALIRKVFPHSLHAHKNMTCQYTGMPLDCDPWTLCFPWRNGKWHRPQGSADRVFVAWFEHVFRLVYPQFDGWYVLPGMDDFSWHDEICIYNTPSNVVRRPIEIRCRYAPLRFLELCVDGVSKAQLWHRVCYRSYDPAKSECVEHTDTILKLRGVHEMYNGPRFSQSSWDDGYKPLVFRRSDTFLWDARRTRLLDRREFERILLEQDIDNIRFVRSDDNMHLLIAAVKRDPRYILHMSKPPDEVVAYIFFKHPKLLPLFTSGRASVFVAKLQNLVGPTCSKPSIPLI
jgi:hypothetical protein